MPQGQIGITLEVKVSQELGTPCTNKPKVEIITFFYIIIVVIIDSLVTSRDVTK